MSFIYSLLQLHILHGTKWWDDSERAVERMGLFCFKVLSRHLCGEVRKTTKDFGPGVENRNIDVQLRQLYCVSRKAKGELRDVTGFGVFSAMSANLVKGFRRDLDVECNINIC